MDDEAEDAWRIGLIAGHEGLDIEMNPYPFDDDLAIQWYGGWHDGERLRQHRSQPTLH